MLLKDKKSAYHEGILVKLKSSKTTATHRGGIKHADVIGKEPRQLVQSSRGTSYRIHEPTLAEYVRFTPRLVTPVRVLQSKKKRSIVKELWLTAIDISLRCEYHSITFGYTCRQTFRYF